MSLQRPVKDVHVARGFSYRKSVRQVPAHRGLFRDVREESAEDVVPLGKGSFPFQVKDLGVLSYSFLLVRKQL